MKYLKHNILKNIFISMPLIFILIEYEFSIHLLHKHIIIWKIRKAELIFNKITSHKAETLLRKNSVPGIFQNFEFMGKHINIREDTVVFYTPMTSTIYWVSFILKC